MSAADPGRPRHGDAGAARLLQLCAGYFTAYVGTGIAVKWYTGGLRPSPLGQVAFLLDNTMGSSLICLVAILALGWLRLPAARTRRWLGLDVPAETPFIMASGICTAVIVPATTLLYTLPISVMVAMVIMRASVIVISRVVDAVLARRGLLHRTVRPEENWAMVFALLAMATDLLLAPLLRALHGAVPGLAGWLGARPHPGGFDFVRSPLAMGVLLAYVIAYSVRLYWMNVFKLTRPAGPALDNRGYFAIEQVTASLTMGVVTVGLVAATRFFDWRDPRLLELSRELAAPDPMAVASGLPYALVAFFSVFLFMFRGRSATFAGLVNRITSLLAGTAATLLLAAWFHLPPPSGVDWISLGFILVAIGLLARVERLHEAEAAVRRGALARTAA